MFAAIWRTEMWHPITVHFPIVLLLGATFCFLISYFVPQGARKQWSNPATVMLIAGCLTAWVGIYTGDMADGIVARKICDPTVLKDHEIASFTMAYLFSAATALSVLTFARSVSLVMKKTLHHVTFILMLAGSGYLVYTGHLGAQLVYEQGAGVIKPSADCRDFE